MIARVSQPVAVGALIGLLLGCPSRPEVDAKLYLVKQTQDVDGTYLVTAGEYLGTTVLYWEGCTESKVYHP